MWKWSDIFGKRTYEHTKAYSICIIYILTKETSLLQQLNTYIYGLLSLLELHIKQST